MGSFAVGMWTDSLRPNEAWPLTPVGEPGLYRWYLDGPLPVSFDWPSTLIPLEMGDLLYVGKATNLRTRAKHHRLPTSGSALRRTLSSLAGYRAIWRGKSAHPGISRNDDALLTEWMNNNLLLSFLVLNNEEVLDKAEADLRKKSRAPLNKDQMGPEQEHAYSAGNLWRKAAVDLRL